MCRVMAFFRTFGVFLSGFLLTVISLDRYSAVLHPLTVTTARRRLRKLILAAWMMAALCSLPQAFIFHVEKHPEHTWFEQCVTFNAFPDSRYELAYNLAGTVAMYLGPLFTIIFCYGAIVLRIYGVAVGQEPVVLGRPRTRTLLMTSVIVGVFFLCWTPYNVMSLWYFIDSSSAQQVDPRIQASLFIFAVANSTVNPLVYGYFRSRRAGSNSTPGNSKLSRRIIIVYRAPFRQYFGRCKRGQSSSSDPNNFALPRCTFESPPPLYQLGNHGIPPVRCQMYDNSSSHDAERHSSVYQTVPRHPVKSPSNPQKRVLRSTRHPLSSFSSKSPADDPYDESPFVIQLGTL
ncbi:G protein-coupled receptor rhodopsin-like, partial [Trinorchestia longiramus]